MIVKEIALVLLGYLSGSMLFCKWFPKKIRGIDVAALSDDHNPGTANTFKQAGIGIGILCLIFELSKVIVPVLSAILVCGYEAVLFPLIMAAPAIGHAFPLFNNFCGGKAIAVTFGVLIGLAAVEPFPLILLCGLYLFFSLVVIIDPNEKRTMTTFFLFAAGNMLMFCLGRLKATVAVGCLCLSLVVLHKNKGKELVTFKDMRLAFFKTDK